MGRSVLAILTGWLVLISASFAGQALMAAAVPDAYGPRGEVSNTKVLLVLTSAGVIFAGLAGYVTASIYAAAAIRNVIVLAVVTVSMGIVAAIQLSYTAPLWFHVAVQSLTGPAIVAGGLLRQAYPRVRPAKPVAR